MSQHYPWVRLWRELPSDPKFRAIARATNQHLTMVISVFVVLLTNANHAGEVDMPDEDIAAALDCEITQASAVLSGMEGRVLVTDLHSGIRQLTGWQRRQEASTSKAALRARAWRETKATVRASEPAPAATAPTRRTAPQPPPAVHASGPDNAATAVAGTPGTGSSPDENDPQSLVLAATPSAQDPNTTSRKAKTRQVKTPMPENFGISERVRLWADKNGHTCLEQRLEHFKLCVESRGYQYINWDSALMKAITDDWAKLNDGSQRAGTAVRGPGAPAPSLYDRNSESARQAAEMIRTSSHPGEIKHG